MANLEHLLRPDDPTTYVRGWMSPEGVPHICNGEHCMNPHPEMRDELKNVSMLRINAESVKRGYCRFTNGSAQMCSITIRSLLEGKPPRFT
jgi:hypothetical protein